ncbi:5-oxoprolinase subunit C family protein [Alteromonas gilva]|uniref:Biotin-dependent carboxyltransferase family protein n=1 Tax=Alteromonas gilva TaxID=2987522 RepID=A0ABT5L2F8_9ALTE|nr:biotin-dependent carboxyltransferase family protein [Alteromonas gilva]MDC8831226.1 biotin-dependent carboxyltransferase family protein [Alteromonas gilva]
MLTIDQIGLAAYIVDSGRHGHLHDGFCQAGPLDPLAFKLANLLCSQSDGVAIEFLGPLTCTFTKACFISVTGPAADIRIDGTGQPGWQTLSVKAGQTVAIEPARLGTKHYLAVSGGIKAPKVMGSASTVSRERLGGLNGDGSSLKSGDQLELNAAPSSIQLRNVPQWLIPAYQSDIHVALVPGYQHEWVSPLQWRRLLSSDYTLTSQMDRMGYRLSGAAINTREQALYSEAVALGAMQIPPDGQPIVMMADRQTLGGYPKVGTIARCDLNRFAQCVPGDKITFFQLDADDARAKWLLTLSAITRWYQG